MILFYLSNLLQGVKHEKNQKGHIKWPGNDMYIYIYIIDVDTYSVGIQSLFWGACSKSLRRKSANLFCIEMVLDVAELGKET